MQIYTAPLRDMRFVMHELHASASHLDAIGETEINAELIDSVLEEAGKFASGVMLPLNASGDEEGCVCENGIVRTPRNFPQAYAQMRDGGWCSVASDPAYGGQGLPEIVGKMVEEIFCSANLSLSLYAALTRGAVLSLEGHGSDALKSQYLPKMVSGEWPGTMNLTEAHCGTDLGLLRTKAIDQGDGSHRITGSKIFISAGEHDLSENIIHLVLARLADAPKGVKGISLFLVPKFLPDVANNPGARNGVSVAAIEHKMGLKGSATCQLNFDDATGYLIGEPNKGLAAMFTMMNAERLSVGIQGLGIAETAYQSAVFYAKDRLQGRAPTGAKHPDKMADPILVHPDVRRNLMTVRAGVEGCRALSGWVAQALDLEAKAQDAAARAAATDFIAFMTPVVKALFTDFGFELSSMALQVYGGHGYIRDHGMEQLVRDARIAMIYEGTNGIQAMDLVTRKLPAKGGAILASFTKPLEGFLAANESDAELAPLREAFGHFTEASSFILQQGGADPEIPGASASDYLRLTGLVTLAYLWARTAKIAARELAAGSADASFYQAKLITAQFYNDRILPQTWALLRAILSGKSAMMGLTDEMF